MISETVPESKFKIVFKVALVCVLAWYLLKYINNPSLEDGYFIDTVNLIFHEAGHTILFFLGDFMRVAGGSLMQLLIPLFCCSYFFFRKEYYSSSLLMLWVGQNLVNISVYAGDAQRLVLPLLGGDAVIHDWNYLLNALHIIQYTEIIAKSIYLGGVLVILIGVVGALRFSTRVPSSTLK